MAKEKKPKTMDDILSELRGKSPKKLEDAFSHYDSHMDEDKQKDIMLNVFAPAMDDFYNAFTSAIDEEIGDDKAMIHKNEKGVKKAIVSGLKAYLKRVRPSALEAIKGVEDEMEQYKILTTYVDADMPFAVTQDGQGIKMDDMIKQMMDGKKKVNDMKVHFYTSKADLVNMHKHKLNDKYVNHLFSTYSGHELAAYLQPEVEKRHSIEDKTKFVTLKPGELLSIHSHLKKGKEIGEPGKYGLAHKEYEN